MLERASLYLALGSVVSALVSIAVSQTLLGLALAAVLASGQKLRFPPIAMPLALFMILTVVSLALSGDPWAGRPQIRKFIVFLTLVVVSSAIRKPSEAKLLVLLWVAVGGLSAARGLSQYYLKYEQSQRLGQDFYQFYVGDRITGFMSHWMTFGGQMMIVLLMGAALFLFSPGGAGRQWALALCSVVVAVALALSFTRSIWPGVGAGSLYLVWHWRRWMLLALPVVLAAGFMVAPAPLRARIASVWNPSGRFDSNEHRAVLRAAGWRMIQAHPVFGVGPMMVPRRFAEFAPPDAPKPLPAGWWYDHLHNNYIHYAAERGLPALAAFLWLIAKVLWDFRRALARLPAGDRDGRFLLHGAMAAIAAILVSGLWEVNLGDSEVLAMFLAVISCGYVAVEATRPPEAAVG